MYTMPQTRALCKLIPNYLGMGQHSAPQSSFSSPRAKVHVSTRCRAAHAAADLSALWDAHVAAEFQIKDANITVDTMAVKAGATCQRHTHPNPADTSITPVHRTVGETSVVDEMVVSFTHDTQVDWMLPGIAPTHRKLAVPVIVSILFEGEKLKSERIYWDQAGVLVQIGLLDPAQLPGMAVRGAAEQSAKVLNIAAVPFQTDFVERTTAAH